MSYTYILYSRNLDKTYTGFSRKLPIERLRDHLSGKTKTTSMANDWELIWYAFFPTVDLAFKFERYLKTHSGRVFMRRRLLGGEVKTIDSR